MGSIGVTFRAIDSLHLCIRLFVVRSYMLSNMMAVIGLVITSAAVIFHHVQMLCLGVLYQGIFLQGLKITGSARKYIFMAELFVVYEVSLLQGFVWAQLALEAVKGFLDEVAGLVFLSIFARLATNAHTPKSLVLVQVRNVTCYSVLVEGFVVAAFTSISHLLLVHGDHVGCQILVLGSCVITLATLFLLFIPLFRDQSFFVCDCSSTTSNPSFNVFNFGLNLLSDGLILFKLGLILCNLGLKSFHLCVMSSHITFEMFLTLNTFLAANSDYSASFSFVDYFLVGGNIELEVGLVVAAGALEPLVE